jgi:hypothetical protein
MRDMLKSGSLSRNSTGSTKSSAASAAAALRLSSPQQSFRRLGLCSQLSTAGEHSSPIVFPEKRSKLKSGKKNSTDAIRASSGDHQDAAAAKNFEHRIDIPGGGDEKSDLLGYVVFSGKLALDKRKISVNNNNNKTDAQQQTSFDTTNQAAVDAKLTSKALLWGSHVLHLDDVISVILIHCFCLRLRPCFDKQLISIL